MVEPDKCSVGVETDMRRVIALLMSMVMLCSGAMEVKAAEAPQESELYAKAAVLLDADSGRVLYSKNGEEPLANASTTKILTCILILENCNLEDVTEVSANAASQPKVRLGMSAGQQFVIKDLLYGLMLESFNDCAVALAEHMAGTVEGFAACMNEKAGQIGCTDSYFITPNGLDGKDENGIHHTTAEDLANIMKYCIRESPQAEQFLEITRAANHSFSDVAGKANYSCTNHNAFLQMMEGALSGKTGFTGTAGYCYVGALERDGKTLIVALLACGWPNNKTYKWADTKKLMQYGLDAFSLYEVASDLKTEEDLPKILVSDGRTAWIGEKAEVAVQIKNVESMETVLIKEGEQVETDVQIQTKLYAPVRKGSVIGTIVYRIGEEVIRKDSVVAAEEVQSIDFTWCYGKILDFFEL